MKTISLLYRLANLLVSSGKITNQDIYDFYAISGSLTQEYFEPEINSFALKIYDVFLYTFQHHPVRSFIGGDGVPSLEYWEDLGGSVSLYQKLYKEAGVRLYNSEKPLYEQPEDVDLSKFVGCGDLDLNSLDLSFSEIDELYEVLDKRDDVKPFFRGQQNKGQWKRSWDMFKQNKPKLLGSNLDAKISAIDRVLGLVHHNKETLLEYINMEETSWEALNAKFNAKTPADFWDKVSPNLSREINKIRRSELSLPIITFNKERESEIFTESPHE